MTTTTDRARLEHPIGAQGFFKLRVPAGDVLIRGTDGEAARVRELGGRALDEIFKVEAEEGRLALLAPDRFSLDQVIGFASGRRLRSRLEIEVPRGAEIEIETASAGIRADGITGRIWIRTASGDITLVRVSGEARVDGVSSRIRVVASGDLGLRAHTISGDIEVTAPRLTSLEAGTTSGDVRVDAELSGPGPWSIDSISGDARIVGRSGMTIQGRTVSGDLESDLPHRSEHGHGRRRLVVGDGAATLAFNSVSGDLRVTGSAGTAAPEPVPAPGAPPAPEPAEPAAPPVPVATDPGESARMEILRALERGEIDVAEAADRLAAADEG